MISNRCSTVQLAAILSVFERVSAFVQTRYKSLISQFLSNISECRTLVGVFWWLWALCIHHWNWWNRHSRHWKGIQQQLPRCLRCEMLDVEDENKPNIIIPSIQDDRRMKKIFYGKKEMFNDVHAKQAFWRIPKWTESSACVYVWSVCLDVPEVFMKW